jgi:hypothetical protein
MEQNLYKCERPSMETVCSALLHLIQSVPGIKVWIFENMLNTFVTFGNYVFKPDIKAITVQMLTLVLTTS